MWQLRVVVFGLLLGILTNVWADGYSVTNRLWIHSSIDSVEKGSINALWVKGGSAKTSRGDEVIWGHFYANPNDVNWGDENNPDLFVKIWFDAGGRTDVNFFHVSVPTIAVYSKLDNVEAESKRATMDYRYVRHFYQDGKAGTDYLTTPEVPSQSAGATQPTSYQTINDLRIGAFIETVEKGNIQAVWRLGGVGTSARGDQIVWGFFYANPQDVSWGNADNPDIYVKIWFDVSGRVDVNFFHVSVPNAKVFSGFGKLEKESVVTMDQRYTRHEYQYTKPTNHRPTASPISTYLLSTAKTQQIDLIGNDADGDTLQYELSSPRSGTGYTDATVYANEAKLYLTLTKDFLGIITLQYRVTDGIQFSEPATIDIEVVQSLEGQGLGLLSIDPRSYAEIEQSSLNPNVFGAPGAEPSLPRSIDLSGNFPPVGNQGRQGSCVAWATAYALKSYQERMEVGWSLKTSSGSPNYSHVFSPAFIYNQINDGEDNGSSPADALDLIIRKGAATWATMPYSERDYRTQPSAKALQEAAQFKGAAKYTATSTQAIKAALANRLPVVAGIFVYKSFEYLSGRNPVYNTAGTPCDPDLSCGHAVTIVGYDDDKYGGAFKVINSWGQDWGDDGYFWLPYSFARHTAPWDGPVLYMGLYLKDASNADVTPTPEPIPVPQELANLQVENWTTYYDAKPGGIGSLEYSVVNTGQATVDEGVDINLMLSTDQTISSNDVYVVYEEIPFTLESGSSAYRDASNSIEFEFPSDLDAGTYYLAMWVDDLNEVSESNETDNISHSVNRITIEDNLPDLVINYWYVEWDEDGNGSFEYKISNEGVANTQVVDWDINLILTTNDNVSDSRGWWTLFSERGNHILEPGSSVYRDRENPASFNIFRDIDGNRITSDTYYIVVFVDKQQRELEADENNNFSIGSDLIEISRVRSLKASTNAKHESYNGKPLPKQISWRPVQILSTPDGKVKLTTDELQTPIFAKENHSADAVVFPINTRIPMPRVTTDEP